MKKVEIEDILKYRFPENLKYSPNGDKLVWQLAYADPEKNTYRRDIWAYKDGKVLKLTSSIDSSIMFWEDDDTLIISRKAPGSEYDGTELYSIRMDGGEAEPFMKLPLDVQEMKKLGDNEYAFTASIKKDDPDSFNDDDKTRAEKKKKKEENLDKDYDVYDEVPYWINGVGKINGQRTALFSLKIRDKERKNADIERLTDIDHNVEIFETEGKMIYYTLSEAKTPSDFLSDIYSFNMDTNKVSLLYGKHDLGFAGLSVLGGRIFTFATDYRTYGINESPYLYELKDGRLLKIEGYKPLTSLYNSVVGDTMLGGGEESKSLLEGGNPVLYTITTVEDHTEIIKIVLSSGEREVVVDLPGSIYFMDLSDDKIALAYGDSADLTEIFTADRFALTKEKSALTKLTSHNEDMLKDRYVALPKRIDYESEGLKLHGFVLLPEDYDPEKKIPAILDVHGGPRCVYGELFFHEMQVWAGKGFAVMYTNIKGSDGRGDDFADIRGDYGGTDFKNLMDFVDAVLEKYPNIDKSKICETGGSYGGFMTNWIVTHTDRFCAAASQRSISNWISMSYISDIGPYFGPDQCGITYDEWFKGLKTQELWDHSPLKYVDNAKTPTLFIHSDEDYRCPLPEGMQMMQALSVRGVETRMVVFHGENHELSRSGKPKHRVRRLTEITKWFESHTK